MQHGLQALYVQQSQKFCTVSCACSCYLHTSRAMGRCCKGNTSQSIRTLLATRVRSLSDTREAFCVDSMGWALTC